MHLILIWNLWYIKHHCLIGAYGIFHQLCCFRNPRRRTSFPWLQRSFATFCTCTRRGGAKSGQASPGCKRRRWRLPSKYPGSLASLTSRKWRHWSQGCAGFSCWTPCSRRILFPRSHFWVAFRKLVGWKGIIHLDFPNWSFEVLWYLSHM